MYSWSQFTLPAGIPAGNFAADTHPNDPASPGYNSGNHTWIGETFTFNGGAPSTIEITDDDDDFEDGYVESGAAQTLTTGITIDGTFYPAGSVVENEFALVDTSGQEIYVVRINGQNVGFTYANGEEPTAGESFTATSGLDGAPADNAGSVGSSSTPYSDVICFAAGTRITTPHGPRLVEDLSQGDQVVTQDDGSAPLLWVGQTRLVLGGAAQNLKPVLFPAGSLGAGLPQHDLIVSQQHRMLVGAGREDPGVFAPAKGLLPLYRVRIMQGLKSVTYVHLLLPRHSVIFAEGTATESFYPGVTALGMVAPDQREALLDCLPAGDYGPTARPCLTVKAASDWARQQRCRNGSAKERVQARAA